MDLYTINTSTEQVKEAYAESRIGGRSENQDSYGYTDSPFGFVITVCDGMGGGPGGKTASTIAVQEILNCILNANQDDTVPNVLLKAIRQANLAIIAKTKEKPELTGMGSTCTVLVINERCATVAYVGDSRVYQFRNSSKVFRTFDHSMVFELVKQKVITEEQARLSAQSNVITKALGVSEDVQPDYCELPYLKGDRFLLCSDGIHGSMPEPELIKLVTNRKPSLGALVDDIATKVDNIGHNSGGYHDNLTLAVVETKSNSILKTKMSMKTKVIITILSVLLLASLIGNIYALKEKQWNPFRSQETMPVISDSLHMKEIEDLKMQIDDLNDKNQTLSKEKDSLSNLLNVSKSETDSLKSEHHLMK